MILETNVFKETGGVPLAHCMNGRAEKSVASSVLSIRGQMCCEAWAFLQVTKQVLIWRGEGDVFLSTVQHNRNRV